MGNPAGDHSMPISVARVWTRSPGWPGTEMPDRSPLTSAAKTGTPSVDSCSARSWSVFVFPVPVAPAMRPWRFIIEAGTWTAASGATAPSLRPLPSETAAPSVA